MALLSATIGEPERLREWLRPCQLITSASRTPLSKQVWQLEQDEDPDEVLIGDLRSVLAEPSNAAIVFVYRREAADGLAKKLAVALGSPVLSYHSGQSATERSRIRSEFKTGACRCVVATTALASRFFARRRSGELSTAWVRERSRQRLADAVGSGPVAYSQNDEDSILSGLFERLAVKDGFFVEIGASDGAQNCTRNLAEHGWNGLWVEADPLAAAKARSVAPIWSFSVRSPPP